jgi:hypothetical protein
MYTLSSTGGNLALKNFVVEGSCSNGGAYETLKIFVFSLVFFLLPIATMAGGTFLVSDTSMKHPGTLLT